MGLRWDPRRARFDFHAVVMGQALRKDAPPDHLDLDRLVAERYKDQVNDMMGLRNPLPSHPAHTRLVARGGIWFPEQPAKIPSPVHQFRLEWRCKHRRGGHWWHPADAMIEWFCCGCGATRDGNPEDGT